MGVRVRCRASCWSWGGLAAAFIGACARAGGSEPVEPHQVSEAPVSFRYATVSGGEVGSAATRGRVTILLYLTTYDSASQIVARELALLARAHRPRINVVAIVLESPKYAVLAQVFKRSLELHYPVAMADEATLRGGSPVGRLQRVPTLVVLDRRGRKVWRREGFVIRQQLEQALNLAEAAAR